MYAEIQSLSISHCAIVVFWLPCLSVHSKRLFVGLLEEKFEQTQCRQLGSANSKYLVCPLTGVERKSLDLRILGYLEKR